MDFNFTIWVDYFKENKRTLHHIDWMEPYQLTSDEYDNIYRSIQQFQIGESSEGKFLTESGKRYLSHIDDKSYLQALILFIQEEQRHANDLAKFMDKQQIAKIKKHWVDDVFRGLRRFANLEQSITVLLTAELIATVYYEALKKVTNSKVLVGICEQILKDEDKHVEFQATVLNKISRNRSRLLKRIASFIRMFLLVGTLAVVWFYHYKVLKAGGYCFFLYFKSTLKAYRRAESLINKA